jgi:hypothetical protein
MSCKCEREEEAGSDIRIGVQFEARDIDLFEEAMERARVAVKALGEATIITAEAMERLSRASQEVRRSDCPPCPPHSPCHEEDTP